MSKTNLITWNVKNFGMTFEHSKNLKSYILILPVFIWNKWGLLKPINVLIDILPE